MTRILGALLAAVSVLPAGTVTSHFREGNSIFLRLSDGSAQVEWLSESSFRFTRSWDGNFVVGPAANPEPVQLSVTETPEFVTIAAKYVVLTIAKNGVLVRAAEPDGPTIMADAGEAEHRDGSIAWERMAPPRVRYFGLGAREDSTIELRGSRIVAVKPFLLSSLGYGELHVAPGDYTFDMAHAKADRYRIEAHRAKKIDYYFFQGPAPKQVLEQLLILNGPIPWLSPREFDLLKPAEVPASATVINKSSLAGTIHSLINGSLSGVLLPALSLDATESKRAKQIAAYAPIVFGSHPDSTISTSRSQLLAYFATYAQEARERGLPLIRALSMQFPKDLEAAKVSDEFMLGDELLIAPVDDAQNSRSVYLPMGIWTRLSDNQVYPGRQSIRIQAGSDELPVFSRNGSIVPLGANPMKLHYFPKLGGEFFLFENELGDYSQVHAGPAGDIMRLQIESKLERDYEWIVHHSERPREVVAGEAVYSQAESLEQLKPGSWFYDATNKNVHVRAFVAAHGNVVVGISF